MIGNNDGSVADFNWTCQSHRQTAELQQLCDYVHLLWLMKKKIQLELFRINVS